MKIIELMDKIPFKFQDKATNVKELPEINQKNSIALFYAKWIENLCVGTDYVSKIEAPFANQFRGSGKTKLGTILQSKRHILDNFDEIFQNLFDTPCVRAALDSFQIKNPILLKFFEPEEIRKLFVEGKIVDEKKFIKELFMKLVNLLPDSPASLMDMLLYDDFKTAFLAAKEKYPALKIEDKLDDKLQNIIDQILESQTESHQTTNNTSKTQITKFKQICFWHIDEVTDVLRSGETVPIFREVWEKVISLFKTKNMPDQDTLHISFFSGNFSFEDFGKGKGQKEFNQQSPSKVFFVPLEAFTVNDYVELQDQKYKSNEAKTNILNIKLISRKRKRGKTNISRVPLKLKLAQLQNDLFGGIPRFSVGFLDYVDSLMNEYLKTNQDPKGFMSNEEFSDFSSNLKKNVKEIASSVDQSMKIPPSAEAICCFTHYKLFGFLPSYLQIFDEESLKFKSGPKESISNIAAKSMLYLTPFEKNKYKIVTGDVVDVIYWSFFPTEFREIFSNFRPFSFSISSTLDDTLVLEKLIEFHLVKCILNQDFPLLKDTCLKTTNFCKKIEKLIFPKVTDPESTKGKIEKMDLDEEKDEKDEENEKDESIENEEGNHETMERDDVENEEKMVADEEEEIKSKTLTITSDWTKVSLPEIKELIEKKKTITSELAESVIKKLSQLQQSNKILRDTTLFLIPRGKSKSADLFLLSDGKILEIQAKNEKKFALTESNLKEEFEKSFLHKTSSNLQGTLVFFVLEYQDMICEILKSHDCTFQYGKVLTGKKDGNRFLSQDFRDKIHVCTTSGDLWLDKSKNQEELEKFEAKKVKFTIPRNDMEAKFLSYDSFEKIQIPENLLLSTGFGISDPRQFLFKVKDSKISVNDSLKEIELAEYNLIALHFGKYIFNLKKKEEEKENQRQEISKMKHLTLCLWLNKCGIEKGIIEKLSKQTEFDGANLLEAYDQFAAGTDVEFLIQLMGISSEEFGKISIELKKKLGE